MNLKFEITGACAVPDADLRPNEQELADAIQQILEYELDIKAIIYISNMREEK